MNRTLSTALVVAAVVGSTAGTVVATRQADSGAQTASDGSGTTGPEAEPSTDGVLWVDRAGLHDGDTTVDVGFVDPLASVQRADGGWVVAEAADTLVGFSPDFKTFQVSFVRPDGTVSVVARTNGAGDVSPDGRRYLAGTTEIDGYGVWDIASGERVQTIDGGRTLDQLSIGGAQYVDDDTVATTWFDFEPGSGPPEVLLTELATSEQRVLAEDTVGDWGISPDGRWFVSSLAVEGEVDPEPGADPMADQTGGTTEGCTVVRSVAGGRPDLVDCGGIVEGVPVFSPDSGAVLTLTGDADFLSGFRSLPLDGGPDRLSIPVPVPPDGDWRAVHLARDRVVVARPARGGGTRILLCVVDDDCGVVGTSTADLDDVAVGS